MTLPPCPCLSIWRPAARAISQDCVTCASMTSRKSSGFWSTILETLFWPDATTRMSTRPNVFTAASTMASQFASELGRLATISTLPLSFSHSAAIFLSSSALLAQITTFAPAPASTFAASAPNAPVAPVTIAVLPWISNRESGFFRTSSDMGLLALARTSIRHPEVRAYLGEPRRGDGPDSARHSSRPAKTRAPQDDGRRSFHRRDGDRDGADFVAAVDDLAAFIGADIAAVALLHDGLLAASDHRQLARQHVVDLLGRRCVRAGAAAGQEMRDAEDQRLRAAHLGTEHAQRLVVAVIGSLVGLRVGELADYHQNFSPFSMR